jgi:hypothetical protein
MFDRMFRKKSFERDLDEELEVHLEIEAWLLMERGLSSAAATLKARQTFGNRTQIAESTRAAWGWGWEWLDRLLQDLRFRCELCGGEVGRVEFDAHHPEQSF